MRHGFAFKDKAVDDAYELGLRNEEVHPDVVVYFKSVYYYEYPNNQHSRRVEMYEPTSELAKRQVEKMGITWPMNEETYDKVAAYLWIDYLERLEHPEFTPELRMTYAERKESEDREDFMDREEMFKGIGWR